MRDQVPGCAVNSWCCAARPAAGRTGLAITACTSAQSRSPPPARTCPPALPPPGCRAGTAWEPARVPTLRCPVSAAVNPVGVRRRPGQPAPGRRSERRSHRVQGGTPEKSTSFSPNGPWYVPRTRLLRGTRLAALVSAMDPGPVLDGSRSPVARSAHPGIDPRPVPRPLTWPARTVDGGFRWPRQAGMTAGGAAGGLASLPGRGAGRGRPARPARHRAGLAGRPVPGVRVLGVGEGDGVLELAAVAGQLEAGWRLSG